MLSEPLADCWFNLANYIFMNLYLMVYFMLFIGHIFECGDFE